MFFLNLFVLFVLLLWFYKLQPAPPQPPQSFLAGAFENTKKAMEQGQYLHKGPLLHEPFYNGMGIRNKTSFWKRQKGSIFIFYIYLELFFMYTFLFHTENLAHIQRLALWKRLKIHEGCVNSIVWNDKGSLLLSGGDDRRLVVQDPFTLDVHASIPSGHRGNIFSARFLPCDDRQLISCCGAGEIRYTIADREDLYGHHVFNCHLGTTYDVSLNFLPNFLHCNYELDGLILLLFQKVITIESEPHVFLSCGEDNTVRFFDLRTKTGCSKRNCQDDVLIRFRRAVTTLAANPRQSYYLATGSSDSIVRIFDRRMLSTPRPQSDLSTLGIVSLFKPNNVPSHSPITSVQFANDGNQCLASFSGDKIYLFDTKHHISSDQVQQLNSASSTATSSDNSGVKRLRLRGDWSDTGPLARPESERRVRQPENEAEEREQRFHSTMQRVSDVLTNWLVNYMNRQVPSAAGTSTNVASNTNIEAVAEQQEAERDNDNVASNDNNEDNNNSETTDETDEQRRNSGNNNQLLPEQSAAVSSQLLVVPGSNRRSSDGGSTRGTSSSTGSGNDDDADADDDDDGDENDGGGDATLRQRNAAALSVQRLFRRRAKDKRRQLKEWNELPHCYLVQKYKGHRSVRTMVRTKPRK